MIDREKVFEVLRGYDKEKIKIGCIASHSGLDVYDGAIEEGFRTVAVCEKGREEPYTRYFKAKRDSQGRVIRGVVDEALVLDKFKDAVKPEHMDWLAKNNVIFIPNRSFFSYAGMDAVEDDFVIPMMGSRNLLRSEERGEVVEDYYWLLERVDLPAPERIESPEDIDSLALVKLKHKVKRLERGFFTAASYAEYQEKSQELLKNDVITEEDLQNARIEKYIIGPVFNFDFFYSPLEKGEEPIELLGIDWRFETSLDGHVRLPASQQLSLLEGQRTPEYTVCGHNAATLRESLLRKVFPLAEIYVRATQEYFPPGMIGPFTLQTCVDKDMNFFIYDVSPRIGGGTNVHMSVGHPYGNTLWRSRMSTGRRVAMEIRRAIETDELEK
ncbi:MAG: formate--phosphoribosylaminoimidazolecarboxamide ligase family protein, partial [Thermoplasmata archaeon]